MGFPTELRLLILGYVLLLFSFLRRSIFLNNWGLDIQYFRDLPRLHPMMTLNICKAWNAATQSYKLVITNTLPRRWPKIPCVHRKLHQKGSLVLHRQTFTISVETENVMFLDAPGSKFAGGR
jgi:hypothetical protein